MLYPGKAKKAYQKPVSYARRGMDLENQLPLKLKKSLTKVKQNTLKVS